MPPAPELLPENERSYETWKIVQDQVRIGPNGVYALVQGDVLQVLELRHDDPEWELTKMREIFYETYIKGKK